MRISLVHDQAIAARMALIVGAITFDRLLAGARFEAVPDPGWSAATDRRPRNRYTGSSGR